MIRVLLADDQPLVREGFRRIVDLAPDMEVVGEAGDGVEAVRLASDRSPDVVVMDIRMPRMDGLAATESILAADARVKVIVLTTFDLDEYVFAALQVGASGFLLKDTPLDQLVSGVRLVAHGDALLSPAVTRRVIAEFVRRRRRGTPDLTVLSAREVDVLTVLLTGATNAEIAARLFVSEATVKSHVRSMLGKLGLRDRTQLVIAAYEGGLA
ncbi:MAG TPA: response regulator transcription factor [Nocardioides sp.]|uniref:response regulator transcription factor n=1 Tax=Nocardioides sp. TaxID=35761 RepID=UPI002C4EC5B1|nr:response regulator transcription factor [Nocardioides sp.]HQR25969.1 response regulator transcription factor [Nocardioides sp.]